MLKMFQFGERTLSVKTNPTKTNVSWSQQQRCRMQPLMLPRHTHGNTLSQARTSLWHMHPQRQTAGPCLWSRQSVDPRHVESKRFEAYVKSLRIQNKALSRTLCLGWAACSLLCFSPRAASNANLQVQDETYHHLFCSVLFCCAPRPCTLLHPSRRPPQICLRGLRGRHNTQEIESVRITRSGRSCLAVDGRER